MKIMKNFDIKRAELAMTVMKKPKNENEKEKQKLKGDILILSNNLLNDKKINKATYNKMFSLFMGSSRMSALEDAYNTLNNIKKSKEIKVVKKAEFHELKTKERTTRETKEGKEDKFMMIMAKKNTKKTMHKYHLTAIIDRNITYTSKKSGKVNVYTEKEHSRLLKGHDKLTDSRVIEAGSLEEAKKVFYDIIQQEQEAEEYSTSAWIKLADVQFIDDPIIESNITASDSINMPLRQLIHLDYNFTKEEKAYLSNENTCVIDNLIGVYGKELKLNKDKLIALNKKFHGYEDVEEDNEPEYIESDLGDLIINPKYNNDKELKKAQAKLKQYENEYNKTQHEYYIDEINDLKSISLILKHMNHLIKNLYIILIMLLHQLLLISFVKHMVSLIMLLISIKLAS